MLATWVAKLYFENGDKNVKLLFCFAKQDRFLHVCLMIICRKVICIGLLSLKSNIRIYVQQ